MRTMRGRTRSLGDDRSGVVHVLELITAFSVFLVVLTAFYNSVALQLPRYDPHNADLGNRANQALLQLVSNTGSVWDEANVVMEDDPLVRPSGEALIWDGGPPDAMSASHPYRSGTHAFKALAADGKHVVMLDAGDFGTVGNGPFQVRSYVVWVYLTVAGADMLLGVSDGTNNYTWGLCTGPIFSGYPLGPKHMGNTTNLPLAKWTPITLDLVAGLGITIGTHVVKLQFWSNDKDVYWDLPHLVSSTPLSRWEEYGAIRGGDWLRGHIVHLGFALDESRPGLLSVDKINGLKAYFDPASTEYLAQVGGPLMGLHFVQTSTGPRLMEFFSLTIEAIGGTPFAGSSTFSYGYRLSHGNTIVSVTRAAVLDLPGGAVQCRITLTLSG